jgi:Ca2+/H+ antiporter, TMEM165/GDT1 family
VDFDSLGYLAVLLSAATPWLEVVVVVPAAIAAGLNPVLVAVVAFTGNLVTMAAAILTGDGLARRWRRRRGRREEPGPEEDVLVPEEPRTRERGGSARSRRATQVLDRYGLPGLALAGPLVVGTHVSGLLAVALGRPRGLVLAWMTAGLLLWTVGLTVAAVAFGLDALR